MRSLGDGVAQQTNAAIDMRLSTRSTVGMLTMRKLAARVEALEVALAERDRQLAERDRQLAVPAGRGPRASRCVHRPPIEA